MKLKHYLTILIIQAQSVLCLRDPSLIQELPEAAKSIFSSATHQQEVKQLKTQVRQYAATHPDSCRLVEYKAKYDSSSPSSAPALVGLEEFATIVIEALWDGMSFLRKLFLIFVGVAAIQKQFSLSPEEAPANARESEEEAMIDEQNVLQSYALEQNAFSVVGRAALIKRLFEFVDSDVQRNPLVVTSKPGFGKSSLLAKFSKAFANSPRHLSVNLLTHFVGISKAS